jgi:hypothetical protein
MKAKIIQFNWRRNWSRRVAPHLDHELVQASLELGMMMLDPNWQRGDPPFVLGAIPCPNQSRARQALLVSGLEPMPLDRLLLHGDWSLELP